MKRLLNKIRDKNFRKTFLLLFFFFLSFFLFLTPYGMRLLGIGSRIETLSPKEAYEFSLPSPDGSIIEFKRDRRIVFLTFFSLHCPSCMQEIGILKGMKGKIPQDFSIIAINVDGVNFAEELKRFVEEENLWFKIGIDYDGSIAKRYGVYSLPTSFLIDRNFMIRFRFTGPIFNEEELFRKIEEIKWSN